MEERDQFGQVDRLETPAEPQVDPNEVTPGEEPQVPGQDPSVVPDQAPEGELPADAPIPPLPESALQQPIEAVEVPAEAMPGTDADGTPLEAPVQEETIEVHEETVTTEGETTTPAFGNEE